MNQIPSANLLVTGAGGHLGRHVVKQLLTANAGNIIAGSRAPEKLGELVAKGADVRTVDFDDPRSLSVAFKGVDRLLIISTDALAKPGLRQYQHMTAIDAAVKAGIRHVIYTSMLNPEPGSPIPFAPDHFKTEQALIASGLG